jgi:hypothetical protein
MKKSMRRERFSLAVIIPFSVMWAQTATDRELAQKLSNDNTRAATVAAISKSQLSILPVLLGWARNPPPNVNKDGLYIGLADAFGELKAKESVPFLISHISMQRWAPTPNLWMKTPAVVESRLPAVAALIRIGPAASSELMRANLGCVQSEDRLAALFVISRIAGVAGAREFVLQALGEANLQRHWAEDGLKVLEARTERGH